MLSFGIGFLALGLGFGAAQDAVLADPALRMLLWSPSQKTDPVRGAFSLERLVGPTPVTTPYEEYLLGLTRAVADQAVWTPQEPATYLAAAAHIVLHRETFQVVTDPMPAASMRFSQVLQSRKGPEIALALLLWTALRDAPFPATVIVLDDSFYLRLGPPGAEQYLHAVSGRTVPATDHPMWGLRIANAVQLSSRTLVGRYALAMGTAALADGEEEHAATLLRVAWHLAPQTPALYAAQGRLALARWELTRARRCFERALVLDPSAIGALAGKAQMFTRQFRLPEALPRLDRALAADRNNIDVLLVRGEYFLANQDYRAAQDQFQSLVALAPRHALAWSGLALARLGRKDRAAARVAIDQALSLAPGTPEPHYANGEFFFMEQDLDQAFTAYRNAIERNARFAPAYRRRAAIYETWSIPGAALRDYRAFLDILELPPNHALHREISRQMDALRVGLDTDSLSP